MSPKRPTESSSCYREGSKFKWDNSMQSEHGFDSSTTKLLRSRSLRMRQNDKAGTSIFIFVAKYHWRCHQEWRWTRSVTVDRIFILLRFFFLFSEWLDNHLAVMTSYGRVVNWLSILLPLLWTLQTGLYRLKNKVLEHVLTCISTTRYISVYFTEI